VTGVAKNWTEVTNLLTATTATAALSSYESNHSAVGRLHGANDTLTHGAAVAASSAKEGQQESTACPTWKRCLDLGLLMIGLPVVLPAMLVAALIIKLVSKGPVFFKQQRIGYLGKPFTCWKFRTMRVNASQGTHREHVEKLIASNQPMVKLDSKGDKRLIPLGRILRASCMDELPQLINVLLGDMSLVGPRPCMDYEYKHLKTSQLQRFETAPGMTGLWQMKRRSGTSFQQMMSMDIEYVANRSLGLDLKILLLTAPSVVAQVREAKAAKRASA
jgi:lipopolysaccharide/colanic/teichoic acid biosynthesis glycosyltransferase